MTDPDLPTPVPRFREKAITWGGLIALGAMVSWTWTFSTANAASLQSVKDEFRAGLQGVKDDVRNRSDELILRINALQQEMRLNELG